MSKLYPIEKELAGDCTFMSSQEARYQAQLMRDWDCRRGLDVYGVYQEMEDLDAHLFSVLQTRKNAVLACATKVLPGDETPAAQDAARTVERVLARTHNFNTSLFHLLDALGKGYSVAEVLWRVEDEGRVGIEAIRGRYQGDFAYDTSGELWMLQHPSRWGEVRAKSGGGGEGRPPELIARPGEAMVWSRGARRMPQRKFLSFSFEGNTCNPYGAALCAKVYIYCWYKRKNLKAWGVFNERFGAPAALGRYSTGASDEDIALLNDILEDLPSIGNAVLPESLGVEYLEAQRGGNAGSYRELADWCNDEISKAVLGQTLTATEGRRSGSLALAEVHERVRRDYLAADARALGEMLTGQLSRWITDFNHGTQVAAPRVVFDCADHTNSAEELKVDRELVKLGVALPAAYFYEKYRRPKPAEGERVLRYDDANLYQYHLTFGVLTINEVRGTLGLPPVPWGDEPPRQAGSAGDTTRNAGLSSPRNLRGGEEEETDVPDGEDNEQAQEGHRDRRAR